MNEIFILTTVICVAIIGLMLSFFWLIHSVSRKLRVIYYDTDETAKMINANPDDTDNKFISIGNKKFDLTKAKPIVFKGFFGNRILYTIHHKYKEPLDICEGKLVEKVSPDTLNDVIKMKILREFLTPKGETSKLAYLFMLIGGVVGALAVALLFFSGMIVV